MLRERTLLAIGGLFHDIGKVVQRAGIYERWKREELADSFSYEHAYFSYRFMEENLKGYIPEEDYQIILKSAYHHAPFDQNSLVYRHGNYYGSAERSKRTSGENIAFLRPVFLGVEEQVKTEKVYRLRPLSLEQEVLFPEDIDNIKVKEHEGEKISKELEKDYKNLLDGFLKELKSQPYTKPLLFLERVYHLFYKYFWCVPASTWDRQNKDSHYPDISLFDHSRVVSALTASLHTGYNLEVIQRHGRNFKEAGKELRLLLLDGDITGIQNFLYNLSNTKGVGKRLRGKSFFLAVLPELVGRALLRKLEYPYTNLIYAGGGKFWALIGYEEGIEERLKEFQKSLERRLLEEFGGELGFVLTYETFCADELKVEEGHSEFYNVVRRLYLKVGENKKRKFLTTIKDFEDLANRDMGKRSKILCPSCNSVLIEEEKEICRWCETFQKIGSELPRAKYLLFSDLHFLNMPGFYLKDIWGVYLLTEPILDMVYSINSTQMEGVVGFKFLANTVPMDEEGVMEFTDMVEDKEGYDKLGYVRADVDNLGYIFGMGLKDKYSLSRVATLSRSLDLFFSGYLNTLFEKSFKNQVYTVYAGGDDLFVIAHWERALDVTERLHADFKEYTCNVEIFDLSCGVSLLDPKHPIRFGAEEAGEEEDHAKKNKPAIRSLGETLKWEDFGRALKDAKDLLKRHGLKVGRAMIYRIYTLLKLYQREDKTVHMRFYPLFYYFVNRNIRDDRLREDFVNLLIDVKDQYKIRKSAGFILKYMLMKTRGMTGKSAKESLLKEEVEG